MSSFLWKEAFDNKRISGVTNDGDNVYNSVCNYPTMMLTIYIQKCTTNNLFS